MKMTWRDFRAAYDFICNSCGYYLWEKKKICEQCGSKNTIRHIRKKDYKTEMEKRIEGAKEEEEEGNDEED